MRSSSVLIKNITDSNVTREIWNFNIKNDIDHVLKSSGGVIQTEENS